MSSSEAKLSMYSSVWMLSVLTGDCSPAMSVSIGAGGVTAVSDCDTVGDTAATGVAAGVAAGVVESEMKELSYSPVAPCDCDGDSD